MRYELDRLRRNIRQHVRQGQFALVVGFSILAVALTIVEVVLLLPERHGRDVLHEGLLIGGWVAMWRPLEVLLIEAARELHLTRTWGPRSICNANEPST
jgi:hypothetical protein